MADRAFFHVLDVDAGRLVVEATQHAVGPWHPDALHAGPPSALLASAVDGAHPPEDRTTTRVGVEVLRPVPRARLVVSTEVVRPGRKVELLHARLGPEGGEPVMTAAIWRIRSAPGTLAVDREGEPLPDPDDAAPTTTRILDVAHTGYVDAVEVRFVDGEWGRPGPATAWMRQRVPLRDDQPTSPLERVLAVADSGNGISSRAGGDVLGPDAVFVNVDLAVHLTRMPEGEWIGMAAETALDGAGIGLASSVLHDRLGPIGRGAQSLIVEAGATG